MKIIEKRITDLVPYERNPRLNDSAVEYVENSIREFGFKVPIVIDTDNVIIAGHTRLKAAERLGIKTVPCVVADDLSAEQVKAFRIADNRASDYAEWDWDKLELELAELEFGDLDFDLGFNALRGLADDSPLELEEARETEEGERKALCHCPKCGFVFEV